MSCPMLEGMGPVRLLWKRHLRVRTPFLEVLEGTRAEICIQGRIRNHGKKTEDAIYLYDEKKEPLQLSKLVKIAEVGGNGSRQIVH